MLSWNACDGFETSQAKLITESDSLSREIFGSTSFGAPHNGSCLKRWAQVLLILILLYPALFSLSECNGVCTLLYAHHQSDPYEKWYTTARSPSLFCKFFDRLAASIWVFGPRCSCYCTYLCMHNKELQLRYTNLFCTFLRIDVSDRKL